MARLKKVYTDEKYERDRKRYRIQTFAGYVLAAYWVVGIIIGGIHQEDPMTVGIVVLLEGIGTLAYVAFRLYAWAKSWEVKTVYDEDPELYKSRHRFTDAYVKAKEKARTAWVILDVLLALSGIGFLIAGLWKILNVS